MRKATQLTSQLAEIAEQCGKFLALGDDEQGRVGKPGYGKSGCRLSSRGSDFPGVRPRESRPRRQSMGPGIPLTFP